MTTHAPNLAPASSRSDEWRTPANVIVPVRRFLGTIDLDPASSPEGNHLVGAGRYFTREDDGLRRDWYANTLWCNPPFSQNKAFLEKLHHAHQMGTVKEAVFLLPAMTETWLWRNICSHYWWCAWKGRVHFLQPDGTTGPSTFPTALVYLGDRVDSFIECLGPHGLIYTPALNRADGLAAWKERKIA